MRHARPSLGQRLRGDRPGPAARLRLTARRPPALISAIAGGRLAATTTVEAIQEFAHVRAQRRGRFDAAGLAEDYVELLAPLLAVTAEDRGAGLALFARSEGLGALDAVLAAGCGLPEHSKLARPTS
jgi:predicted nucleic acid-binding protein